MPIISTPVGKVQATGRIYTESWKNGAGSWSWHVVSADGKRIAADCHAMTHAIAEREAKRAWLAATKAVSQ